MRLIDADALVRMLQLQDYSFYKDKDCGYPVSRDVFREIENMPTIKEVDDETH